MCIVGAGIAGMTTAYLLAREGKKVVVLDDGPIAGGETCRTTAHIVNALDDRYYDLEKWHGERGAAIAAESHTAAIDRVEEIIREEGIDCDFERVDGYLFVPPGESTEQLGEELRACHRAGLLEVEYVERVPYDAYDFGNALRFPRQAQFHILKYLDGVTRASSAWAGALTKTHARIRARRRRRREGRARRRGLRAALGQSSVVVVRRPPGSTTSPPSTRSRRPNALVSARVKKARCRTSSVGPPYPYHYVRTSARRASLSMSAARITSGAGRGLRRAFQRLEDGHREPSPRSSRSIRGSGR